MCDVCVVWSQIVKLIYYFVFVAIYIIIDDLANMSRRNLKAKHHFIFFYFCKWPVIKNIFIVHYALIGGYTDAGVSHQLLLLRHEREEKE